MLTRPWFWFIAIALITFALFSPLIRADFTAWDDPDTLAGNPKLHPPTWGNLVDYWTTAGDAAPMGLYVPVTYTVWSAASVPNGPSPHVVHAINVSLHAMTAGLVFLLLRRRLPVFPAMVGSAIFALHPAQVEAVGWASGTKDLLCGFFAVATLVIETTPGRSRGMRTIAFGCFILAMLSKPTAMVMPVLLVAWDRYRGTGVPPVSGARGTGGTPVLRRLPWVLASLVCAVVTAMSQPVPWQPTLALWTRPVVALDAIAFYLGKLVWPAHLCFDYGRTPQALLASTAGWWTWSVPILIGGFIFAGPALPAVRRVAGGARRTLLLAAAWFVAPLLPVLGLVPFDFQFFSTVADHYLYLPMIGVALAVAVMLPDRAGWKTAVPIGLVAAVLCVWTVRQQRTWMNTPALARQAIAVNPQTFAGHELLGYDNFVAARSASSPAVAAERFSAAIAEYKLALANNPTYVPSLTNLAECERQSGRSAEALATLHRLVELQASLPPRLRENPAIIGKKLFDYGDPDGAARWLSRHQRELLDNPRVGTPGAK